MTIISTNISSLIAQNAMRLASASQSQAMERLSTGSKINSAADDAAGLAIATRMESQINGLQVAVKNSGNMSSAVRTAEGGLEEVVNALQRMRELALQSVNGTNSSDDRSALDRELQQLKDEINRIATTTSFNNQRILDGSFKIVAQIGAFSGETLAVEIDSVTIDSLGFGENSVGGDNILIGSRIGKLEGVKAGDIQINGQSIGKISAGDDIEDVVSAINDNVDNVKASALNVVKAKHTGDGVTNDGDFQIEITPNGSSNAVVFKISASQSPKELVENINNEAGALVQASLDNENKIVLSNTTGAAITVYDNSAAEGSYDGGSGFGRSKESYSGFLKLESRDGSDIRVNRGNEALSDAGTYSDLAAIGFREVIRDSADDKYTIRGAAVETVGSEWKKGDLSINSVGIYNKGIKTDTVAGRVQAVNNFSAETNVIATTYLETIVDTSTINLDAKALATTLDLAGANFTGQVYAATYDVDLSGTKKTALTTVDFSLYKFPDMNGVMFKLNDKVVTFGESIGETVKNINNAKAGVVATATAKDGGTTINSITFQSDSDITLARAVESDLTNAVSVAKKEKTIADLSAVAKSAIGTFAIDSSTLSGAIGKQFKIGGIVINVGSTIDATIANINAKSGTTNVTAYAKDANNNGSADTIILVSASAIVITEGTTVGGKAIFGTASTVNVADDKYGTIKINNVEIDLDAKGVTTLSSLAASINEAFGDSKNPVTATVSGNKIALKANVDIVLADDQHKTGAITNIFDGAETIAATKSYKVIASASKSYDIDFSKLEKMVVKSVELSGFTYDTSKKFTINGIEIVGQGANLDATITNINAKASTTGVTAFKDGTKLVLISKSAIIVGAVTGVDGSSVLGGAGTVSENSYGRFSLNGKTIELTTNTKAALVAAINSSNSGVMASLSGDSVTLATMNADMILADDTFSTGLVQSLFGGAKTVASKELTLPPSVLSEGDFKVEAAGYGRFKINDTTIDVKNSDLKALALSINKTMESVVESKRVTVSASDDGKTLYFSSGESFTLADDSLKTGAVEALFGKKFDTAILHKEFFSVNKINVEIGNDLQSTVKSINDTMSKENIDLKAEVIATEKKVFASGFDYSTLSTGSKIKINNIEVTIGSDAKATVASINASMAAAALADTKGKLGVLPEAVEKDGALFLKFKTDISIEGVDGNSAISHVMQSKQESNKSDVVFSKLDGRSKISINGKEITLDGKTAAVNPSSSGRVATGNYDLDLSTLEKKAVKTIDLSTTVFSASDKFKINNIEITAGTNLIVTAKNINDSDANVTAYASGNNLILVSNKADTDMIFADSTSDSAVKYLGGAATVSANSYGSFEINGVVVELTDKTTDSVVIAINTAMKAANKPVVATINDSKLSIVSTGGDLTFASVKHSSTTLNSVFGTAETVTAVSEGAALDAVITAINGAFPAGEVVAEKVDGKLVLKTANDDILVFGDIVDSNVKVASLFDLTETDKAPTKVQFISESGASLSVGNGSYGTNGVSDIFGKVIDVAAEKTGLSINGLNIKVAETVTETVGNIRTALEAAGVDLQVSVKGSNLMFQSSTLTQINFGMDSDISADIKGKNIFGADKTNYASLELNSVNNKPISIELSSSSNAKQHGFLEMNIGASDFDSNDPTFGAASGKSLSGISISTLEGSNSAIDSIDAALSHVSKVRTDLGAVQNRLNYTVNNLSSIITNTAEAKSQIVDTNFAIETSAMTKSQILSQASTAMLAQANKMKQGVLSLLR